MAMLPMITTRRRSNRSAIEPAIGESTSDGVNWATRLRATANGQAVSWRIPQASATYCIQVPIAEIPVPSWTRAKSR